MLVGITGKTASGERFQFQAELPGVPAAGIIAEYDGASYMIEASSDDNRGGKTIAAECRLAPARPGAGPPVVEFRPHG